MPTQHQIVRYNDTTCIQGDPELTSLSTRRRSSNVAEKTLANTSTVEHEHDMSFPTVQTAGTHDQRPEPTDHTTESHQPTQHRAKTQSHQSTQHTRNSQHDLPNLFLDRRNATQCLYTALSWRSCCCAHGTTPKHTAHRTASSSSPCR